MFLCHKGTDNFLIYKIKKSYFENLFQKTIYMAINQSNKKAALNEFNRTMLHKCFF